jgi:hypothetical protein
MNHDVVVKATPHPAGRRLLLVLQHYHDPHLQSLPACPCLFWDSAREARIPPNFAHFGLGRDKTVPPKKIRPGSKFQPVLWPNKEPTDIPQPI